MLHVHGKQKVRCGRKLITRIIITVYIVMFQYVKHDSPCVLCYNSLNLKTDSLYYGKAMDLGLEADIINDILTIKSAYSVPL